MSSTNTKSIIYLGTPWNPAKDPWESLDPTTASNAPNEQDGAFARFPLLPLCERMSECGIRRKVAQ